MRFADETVFVSNSTYPRHRLKARLIKSGAISYRCACCDIGPEWNKLDLSLQLDHINGINNDNRLANLRFLCPNCHSQQGTYAGKNKGQGQRDSNSQHPDLESGVLPIGTIPLLTGQAGVGF